MTRQIGNKLDYRGESYSIVGVCGAGLFRPGDYGIQTTMASTACWDGYRASYAIVDDQLLLRSLLVNVDAWPPAVNRIEPVRCSPGSDFNYQYDTVDLAMPFNGGVVIASDYLGFKLDIGNSLYDMGDPPFWHYEFVVEFEFHNGRLIKTSDMSSKVRSIREEHIRQRQDTGDIGYPSLRGEFHFDYE